MKQAQALDILKAGRNVYLTGPAGSGKTFVLNAYIQYLRERGVTIGVTASTGIAATHIGGVTIHSWSGAGIKEHISPYDVEMIAQKEHVYKRIDKTKVLIIDEVSMLSPDLLDGVDRICRAIKDPDASFGGMQIVLTGDFFQLPPITKGSDIRFAHTARAWQGADIRVCYLDEQYRHDDVTLEKILGEMRGGTITAPSRELLLARRDAQFKGDVTPTRLFTHNADVDALNDEELERLPGEIHTFEMSTRGKTNLVQNLVKGMLAPETLRLKKKAVVMFVKNNFEAGYVNGTLGVVEEFDHGQPVVRTFSGDRITVSPAEWVVEEDGKTLARAEQIPLRLAWAITVHKSQGMSLDAAEIDLSKAFVPGQGYVALSRLRTLEGLVLRGINETAFAVHPDVLVFDRVLRKESEKWDKVISRFESDDIQRMQHAFIEAAGGTNDKKEIEKNRVELEEDNIPREKISTYEKTYELILQGLPLEKIADARGVTIGTIINHLEKLRESYPDLPIEKFKPKDLAKIKAAFDKSKDGKLTPIFNKLGKKYSFDELRLARLFL